MPLSFISIVLCCWLNSANDVVARERGRSIAATEAAATATKSRLFIPLYATLSIVILSCLSQITTRNFGRANRTVLQAFSVSGLNKDGTSNARPLLLPLCRRELKRCAAKDLPLRRPNTALIHRILWFDVEIHYVTSGVRKYLAGAQSERDVLDVVKSVERPGPRRPEVEATVTIVDSEWLHRRDLASRA